MTEHLPDDGLPPDALCLIPTEASVGRGFVAETSEDAITLSLLDPRHGTLTVAFEPDLAMAVATGLAAMYARLGKLTPPQHDSAEDTQSTKENDDDDD
jgi:hypothetical protein